MATFALLHGAWHDASCWDQVTESLEELGHTATAPELALHDPERGWVIAPVLRRDDLTENPLQGPLIVEEYDTTIIVPPDATVQGFGLAGTEPRQKPTPQQTALPGRPALPGAVR